MRFVKRVGPCLVAAWLACAGALAADPPQRPWSDVADFGFVATSGNAEGTNFALSNKFKYTWANAELTFDAAALRNESTTRSLSNPNGTVVVSETTTVTASSYALALMYRQKISDRLYWFTGASWYQNFLAGVDDRYIASGGVGYTFVKDAKNLLKGEVGLSYTFEDPLGDPPPSELDTTDFVGYRGYLGYEYKINAKSTLTEDLNFFGDFETSSNWRLNSITALTAGLTDKLAVKVSYTVLYSNDPAVSVVQPDAGAPLGTQDALYTFDTTDMILAVALVVNF